MTRMDNLGEKFTIKFVNDFCDVERSMDDIAAKGLSWYGIYPVPVVGCKVACTGWQCMWNNISLCMHCML